MLQFKKIFTGRSCQNSCRFCQALGREAEPTEAQLDEIILEASAENVLFWGGDPLLRRDLPSLARYAARRGAKRIKVRTTARPLTDARLLETILQEGVWFFLVEVCGPAPEVHDELCGSPGAFEETMAGMAAIRAPHEVRGAEIKPFLECAVPVVKENLGYLEATVQVLVPHEVERVHFELCDPDMGLLKAAQYLRGALETAIFNKVWATTTGLPLCLMAGFEPHVREAQPGGPSGRKLRPCKKCVLREVCSGVDAGIIARQGERQVEGQLAPLSTSRHLEGLRLLHQPLGRASS
jgi:pyruvate-formate lyase-activating enzyme